MNGKKIQNRLQLAQNMFEEGKISESLEVLHSIEPVDNYPERQKAIFYTISSKIHMFLGNVPKASETAEKGMIYAIIAFFVFGLALNLTPCVYPVIPITVSYFSGQADKKKGDKSKNQFSDANKNLDNPKEDEDRTNEKDPTNKNSDEKPQKEEYSSHIVSNSEQK